jgi:hypothetical protein
MRCIIAAALFAALPTAVFADGDAILTISNDAGAPTDGHLRGESRPVRYHLWRLAYQYPYGYGTIDVTCDPGYEFPLSADDWKKIADTAIPNIRDTLVPARTASGVIITAMTPLLRGK